MIRLEKRHLKRAKPENLRRLARWLGLRHDIDTMSHRQLAKLVHWLLTRREKRYSGLTVGNGMVTGYYR
jgi:hypothetical protein